MTTQKHLKRQIPANPRWPCEIDLFAGIYLIKLFALGLIR